MGVFVDTCHLKIDDLHLDGFADSSQLKIYDFILLYDICMNSWVQLRSK